MTIGEIIQHLREDKGLNQKELAEKVGLSHSVMNRIELGKRPARDEELKRIAEVLDVSLDYLMGASDIRIPYKQIKGRVNRAEQKDPTPEEKYPEVQDVEEAMKIILEQPGLMLKGEILSDESKIILANAIQMGLRTAEELEKKKNKGDSHE